MPEFWAARQSEMSIEWGANAATEAIGAVRHLRAQGWSTARARNLLETFEFSLAVATMVADSKTEIGKVERLALQNASSQCELTVGLLQEESRRGDCRS